MSNPIRSANNAYYASKQPLTFRGTREGRKNPVTAPSYRQKPNDVAASSNKYYAEATPMQQPVAAKKQVVASKKSIELGPKVQTLPSIVAAFQNGATNVVVSGDSTDVAKARTAVDLAVGRNTLTRAQADAVSFVTNLTVSDVPAPAAPVVDKVTKKKAATTRKSKTATTKRKTKAAVKKSATKAKIETPDDSSEIDSILNPPQEDEPAVEKVSDQANEDDIAEAFGVTKADAEASDDSDDPFDADSDD